MWGHHQSQSAPKDESVRRKVVQHTANFKNQGAAFGVQAAGWAHMLDL